MRQSKKIAIGAMAVALGVAVMALGALIDTVDLTVAAIASLLMTFLYIEIGAPYTWFCWLATSLIAALLFPASLVWLEYLLIFGIYPLIKALIERLPRLLWWPVRLAFLNAMLLLVTLLAAKIFGVPFFEREETWYKIALFAVANVAFVAYDLFITFMVRIYFAKFRDKIKKFLK